MSLSEPERAPAADTVVSPPSAPARGELVERLREALAGIHVVMLTSVTSVEGEHDGLRARPLTLLSVDVAGGLWFLVDAGEVWVQDLVQRPLVQVSAESPGDGRFVSVSGVAVLSDDPTAIRELWSPAAVAWWHGPEHPDVRVLRVDPTVVDVWRTAPTALGRALEIGKAVLTGTRDPDVGVEDDAGGADGSSGSRDELRFTASVPT